MLNGENTDYGALYEAGSMQITMCYLSYRVFQIYVVSSLGTSLTIS